MSARKSIAKVQLGSVTPDKSALQSKGAHHGGDEGSTNLPYINGHSSHSSQNTDISPAEVRSAEKPSGSKLNGTGRPARGTILQKSVASHSGKTNENTEGNSRSGRPSILHTPHHGNSDGVGQEQQSLRISRPSILNKQPSAKNNNGNTVSSTTGSNPGPHSPTAPTQPKASNRSHRGTLLKHLPKGQSAETVVGNVKLTLGSDFKIFVSTVAGKLVQGAMSQAVANSIQSAIAKKTSSSKRNDSKNIQDLAKEFISISIRDALQNISIKGY